ncbi:MAG: ATP synthase F1 subunit epsilon [Actinobacteria bacterium]|nr:ATP synthase F1 subunit epsilon [Actinomycetota bacterium]
MATFPIEVMTPEGAAFKGEVEMISTRTAIGSLGIKANHQPIMTMLEHSELRLHMEGGEVERYAQGEGYLQMSDNEALLLVEEAIPATELDVDDLRAKLGEAESRLEGAEAESAAEERAKKDVARYTLYLAIAES